MCRLQLRRDYSQFFRIGFSSGDQFLKQVRHLGSDVNALTRIGCKVEETPFTITAGCWYQDRLEVPFSCPFVTSHFSRDDFVRLL